MEIIKMVLGSLLTLGAIVLILVAFKLFYKYMIQEKKCTAKTKGIIRKYSLMGYGGETVGVHLPIVFYTVNGKEYKVKGPEYKSIITKTVASDLTENNNGYYEKNQSLIIEKKTKLRSAGGSVVVHRNPIREMYPLNSEIDVYYDPNNPKLAYVLRYCNKKWAFWLTFLTAIVVLIVDIGILLI